MKTLLSVLVAAAFAATGFNVAAQTKDPTTKGGGEVKSKDGGEVKSKDGPVNKK